MRAIATLLSSLLLSCVPCGATRAATQAQAPRPDQAAARPSSLPGDGWIDSPAVESRLAQGGVAVRSVINGRNAHATVEAAIRIPADASAIWPLITQCKYAAWLIAGLKRCRTLKVAPDGSWAVIEHDIRYAWFLPTVHSVFRAQFHPPREMDFHRIAGNLKYEVGSWRLLPSGRGATTVDYRVSLEPGFWVPRSLIRRLLAKKLPAALRSLRAHAQPPGAEPRHAP